MLLRSWFVPAAIKDALEIVLFMLHPKGRSFVTIGAVPHELCDSVLPAPGQW